MRGADFANIQVIIKFNKEICSLLRVINISSKHKWVIPLKGKKCITITKAFQEILNESSRKAKKKYAQIKVLNFTIDP